MEESGRGIPGKGRGSATAAAGRRSVGAAAAGGTAGTGGATAAAGTTAGTAGTCPVSSTINLVACFYNKAHSFLKLSSTCEKFLKVWSEGWCSLRQERHRAGARWKLSVPCYCGYNYSTPPTSPHPWNSTHALRPHPGPVFHVVFRRGVGVGIFPGNVLSNQSPPPLNCTLPFCSQ